MDKRSRFHLGDGFEVNIWIDPWIPWSLNKKSIAKEPWEGNFLLCVADLIDQDTRIWSKDVLDEVLSPDSIENVGMIVLSTVATKDKLLWTGNINGIFSVKSAYQMHKWEEENNESNPWWKALWTSKLHERTKIFLRRLFSKVLPTSEGIWSITKKGDRDCTLCGEAFETELHIFKHCSFVRAVAFGSQYGIRLDRLEGDSLDDIMELFFGYKRQPGMENLDKDLFILILAGLFDAV